MTEYQDEPTSDSGSDVTTLDPSGIVDINQVDAIRSELFALSVHEQIPQQEEMVSIFLSRISRIVKADLLSVYILDQTGSARCLGVALRGNDCKKEVRPREQVEWHCLFPPLRPGYKFYETFQCVDPGQIRKDPFWGHLSTLVGDVLDITRVPLNGSTQTFGLLECVNIRRRKRSRAALNRATRRLAVGGAALAGAITVWRCHKESTAVSGVVNSLARASGFTETSTLHDLTSVLEEALSSGLNQLQDYRAAVLRIGIINENVRVVAKAINQDLTWTDWVEQDVRPGEYLAGMVYRDGKPITVTDIDEKPRLFTNLDWIHRNGLRSAVCLPIKISNTTIGTLTAYTGFRYKFTVSDITILQTLADAFAIFWQPLQGEDPSNQGERLQADMARKCGREDSSQ